MEYSGSGKAGMRRLQSWVSLERQTWLEWVGLLAFSAEPALASEIFSDDKNTNNINNKKHTNIAQSNETH